MDRTSRGYRPLLSSSIEGDEEKEQYSSPHSPVIVSRLYSFAILFTAFVFVVSLSFNFLLAAKLLDLATKSPNQHADTDSQIIDGQTIYGQHTYRPSAITEMKY